MRIALLQSAPCHDLDEGCRRLEHHLREARAAGVQILVTPEMWLGGYNIAPAQIAKHSAAFESIAPRLREIVGGAGVATVIGCALPGAPRPQNCALAFDASGVEVMRYAKCHLFCDVDETRFTAGDRLSPVFELAGLRTGLAICYDIEFPETARNLALNGAELILVPTANMPPYESVNRRLVPARAEENGVFVAYANLCGREGALTYCGLSCICAPNGETLASAGAEQTLLIAEVDREDVARTQRRRPFLSDRRPDLYGKEDS